MPRLAKICSGNISQVLQNWASASSNRSARYTGLGDKEKALTWLEQIFENRDLDLMFMQAPKFRQVLATEPRYQQLRKKMKLEGPGSRVQVRS